MPTPDWDELFNDEGMVEISKMQVTLSFNKKVLDLLQQNPDAVISIPFTYEMVNALLGNPSQN